MYGGGEIIVYMWLFYHCGEVRGWKEKKRPRSFRKASSSSGGRTLPRDTWFRFTFFNCNLTKRDYSSEQMQIISTSRQILYSWCVQGFSGIFPFQWARKAPIFQIWATGDFIDENAASFIFLFYCDYLIGCWSSHIRPIRCGGRRATFWVYIEILQFGFGSFGWWWFIHNFVIIRSHCDGACVEKCCLPNEVSNFD